MLLNLEIKSSRGGDNGWQPTYSISSSLDLNFLLRKDGGNIGCCLQEVKVVLKGSGYDSYTSSLRIKSLSIRQRSVSVLKLDSSFSWKDFIGTLQPKCYRKNWWGVWGWVSSHSESHGLLNTNIFLRMKKFLFRLFYRAV